jgi:hypothetical protein
MSKAREAGPPLCPSAHTSAPGARLFAVQVRTQSGGRQLAYLPETHPITEQILDIAGASATHEVLRVAAHCVEGLCPHWNGHGCRLATRVATMLPQAVSAMPRCAIRPTCLWFKQEGPAACLRCPQVATIEQHARNELGPSVAQLELEDDDDVLKTRAQAGQEGSVHKLGDHAAFASCGSGLETGSNRWPSPDPSTPL